MWNLSADDVQRAKEELKGRRSAIQARYESELKQLEADIADLETFESFAVKFVSDFKGEVAGAADPEPAAAELVAEIVAQVTAEPVAAEPVAEPATATAEAVAPEAAASPAPVVVAMPEPGAVQKSSSRWRMRLNAGEASQ